LAIFRVVLVAVWVFQSLFSSTAFCAVYINCAVFGGLRFCLFFLAIPLVISTISRCALHDIQRHPLVYPASDYIIFVRPYILRPPGYSARTQVFCVRQDVFNLHEDASCHANRIARQKPRACIWASVYGRNLRGKQIDGNLGEMQNPVAG
jgi:hypothetical protein